MSQALAPEAFIQDPVARTEARRTLVSHAPWLEIADASCTIGDIIKHPARVFSTPSDSRIGGSQ